MMNLSKRIKLSVLLGAVSIVLVFDKLSGSRSVPILIYPVIMSVLVFIILEVFSIRTKIYRNISLGLLVIRLAYKVVDKFLLSFIPDIPKETLAIIAGLALTSIALRLIFLLYEKSKKAGIIVILIVNCLLAAHGYKHLNSLVFKVKAKMISHFTKTPEIIEAIIKNDMECIRHLLDQGTDINIDYPGWGPCIFYANRFETIKFLVENGADVNVNTNNRTLLNSRLASTFHSSYEAVILYLEHGLKDSMFKVNSMAHETPLHYGDICHFCDNAGYKDGVKNVKLLIEHGADMNTKNMIGNPPIFTVGDESKQILIESGAEYRVMNGSDENLLFRVNTMNLYLFLVEHGLDVRQKNKDNQTVLHVTSSDQIAKHLLQYIDINCRDKHGRTPIFYCRPSPEKLKLLLENNADINVIDGNEDNALIWYIKDFPVNDSVKMLLDHGIDVNHKNKEGKTAYTYARSDEIKKMLIDYGAERTQIPRKKTNEWFLFYKNAFLGICK